MSSSWMRIIEVGRWIQDYPIESPSSFSVNTTIEANVPVACNIKTSEVGVR